MMSRGRRRSKLNLNNNESLVWSLWLLFHTGLLLFFPYSSMLSGCSHTQRPLCATTDELQGVDRYLFIQLQSTETSIDYVILAKGQLLSIWPDIDAVL